MVLTLITREPVLVKNPYTGRFVNVAPLFDVMHGFNGQPPASTRNLWEASTRAIRHVNLNADPDFNLAGTFIPDLNFDFYGLKDMSWHIAEF